MCLALFACLSGFYMSSISDYTLRWPLGPELGMVREQLESKGEASLAGLEGSSLAFAFGRLWQAFPRLTLFVCPTSAMAEGLARDLELFVDPDLIRLYPAYEVSPYQGIDPPSEITARRLSILWELMADEKPLLLITSARGIPPRLCPPEHLLDRSIFLQKGMEIDRDYLVGQLIGSGYTQVGLVEQVGDFAVRGAVVDFFAANSPLPIRVELWGDEIMSLRYFTSEDQRSQDNLEDITIIPCYPLDLSPEAGKRAALNLRKITGQHEFSAKRVSQLLEKIEMRAHFTGAENWLTLYFERFVDIFSYLPAHTLRVIVEPAQVEERLRSEAKELDAQYLEAKGEGELALPSPYLRRTPEQAWQGLKAGPVLFTRSLLWQEGEGQIKLRAATHGALYEKLSHQREGSLFSRFLLQVREWQDEGRTVMLVCRSLSQVDRLLVLLAERGFKARALSVDQPPREDELSLVVGNLSRGFAPADSPLLLVTEDEVFGAPKVVRHKAPAKMSAMLAALDDLVPGDLVVHSEHGIARYEGMQSMEVGAAESDFLLLVFQGGDKLYLPADRMTLISKYRGPGDSKPPLDRLGGKMWLRAKGKVKKAIEAIARDLVELYAARRSRKGYAFAPPDSLYREFESTFPFEETPDQARAIEDVISDLMSDMPMDRLVCGDVGFGKTEVALRAAWMVAMQGKQVAILVPTTVLAEQHYQTFAERLRDQPLTVASLSRFRSAQEQKEILARLADGTLDIIIGTHRLLQKDVVFRDLGLMVLDEEHRFGVRDKEKLKKIRRLVDVLTLTATPIPRTLQMSLSGIRDMSIINTPPAERMGIKTYLATFSAQVIEQAIKTELARGGQVFVVHNRVHDITRLAGLIKNLFPEARVGVAHGQLPESALEKVMLDFVNAEVNILVCTTIIESGLDIPAANTIIINDADKLGLSQIYQLRGRVGRGNEKAYAYLLVKSEDSLSRDAARRLKALMDFTHLGAGFAIAMHDLEIRGGGNLLGEVQSGQVASVGYELYVRMLEEATASLKGEEPDMGPEPEINVQLPSRLPESYIPDPPTRLSMYKRLSQAEKSEDIARVRQELEDRFGPLPKPARNLLAAVGIKLLLRKMFAHKLNLGAQSMQVFFKEQPRLDLDKLLNLAATRPDAVKVSPDGKIWVAFAPDDSPLEAGREFLESILPQS